jgi:hypothetical protein
MTELQPFDIVLSEILKRKRKTIPEVLLTGNESMNSKYSLFIIHSNKNL